MASLLNPSLTIHDYTQPNNGSHVHSNREINQQKKEDLVVDDDEEKVPDLEEEKEEEKDTYQSVQRNLFNALRAAREEEKSDGQDDILGISGRFGEEDPFAVAPQQSQELRNRNVVAGKGKSPYVKYNNKDKLKLTQDLLKMNENDSRAMFQLFQENAPSTIRYPYPGSNFRLAALDQDYGLNEQGVVVHRVTLLPHPNYPRMGLPNSPNMNRYAIRPKKKYSNQEVSDYFGDTENRKKAKKFYKKVLNHPNQARYGRLQIPNEIDETPLIRLNQQFALNSRGERVNNPTAIPRPDFSSMSSSSSSSNRFGGDYSAQMSSPPPMTPSYWNLQLLPLFASPLVVSQAQSPVQAPAIPEESTAAESELSELMEEFLMVGKAL